MDIAFMLPGQKSRLPIDRLNRHAAAHSFRLDDLDFRPPVDATRLFLCPTLTPLYYTNVYAEFSAAQTLRYNQLTAMCFSELIGFFEQSFAHTALAMLRRSPESPEIAECLGRFMEEEAKHCEMWRRLNRLSAPDWYARRDRHIIRIPRPVLWLLSAVARRPDWFPAVIWLMLALEEHSMEISRRCARVPEGRLEPRYAAAYRLHLEEEVRHVHTDWHLLERFHRGRTRAVRTVSAGLFRLAMGRFFLRPTGSAVRVVDLLIEEFPDLQPLRPRIVHELKSLDRNMDYQRMMYSRAATPITFMLFDQFPEFRKMGGVLRDYQQD